MVFECDLNVSTIKDFKPKVVFNQYKSPIISMDFSNEGTRLASTAENGIITIYDLEKPEIIKMIDSRTYGAGEIQWGPHEDIIIVSSTRGDNNVRYVSIYDDKIIRTFSGHTGKVTSMGLSPSRDTLLTCSEDKTIRIWDIRDNKCTHKIETQCVPVGAIDVEALVLGVGTNSTDLRMFDFRNLGLGPFNIFNITEKPTNTWTRLRFSSSNQLCMIDTDSPTSIIIESFDHKWQKSLVSGNGKMKGRFFSCISASDSYAFCSGSNGKVHVFEPETGKKYFELESNHRGPINHTLFNPIFKCLATANDEVHLWI